MLVGDEASDSEPDDEVSFRIYLMSATTMSRGACRILFEVNSREQELLVGSKSDPKTGEMVSVSAIKLLQHSTIRE